MNRSRGAARSLAAMLSATVLCLTIAGCGSSPAGTSGAPSGSTAQMAAQTAATAATGQAAEAFPGNEGSTQERATEYAAESETAEAAGTVQAMAQEGQETGTHNATKEEEAADHITFNGETDLEYNARQILEADKDISTEGALSIAAYLWQMGFGKMSSYPVVNDVDGGKVLTVFDEEGLFYNIFLTPEGKIQSVEDVEGNELVALGTRCYRLGIVF